MISNNLPKRDIGQNVLSMLTPDVTQAASFDLCDRRMLCDVAAISDRAACGRREVVGRIDMYIDGGESRLGCRRS